MAWELAATAQPHLNRIDADRIYIAIGVGDVFEAIEVLLTVIARDRIPLSRDLADVVASWLDCYRDQAAESRLRHLLGEIKCIPPHETSAFEQRFASALIAARDRRFG